MKVWLASLSSARRADDVERGVGLMFWDADGVGDSITEVQLLPPRVVAGGGRYRVDLEPFGLNDVPTFTLELDLSNPETPEEFRGLFLQGRRVGVYAASGWVQHNDPLRFVPASRSFVGIWEPDAPFRLRPGEPVEVVFAEIANHAASELILPDWDALHDEGIVRSSTLLTYWTPWGAVSYWLRDVVAATFGQLLRNLLEQVQSRINALLPPNLRCLQVTFWTDSGMWAPAFVDIPGLGAQLHEEPDAWRELDDTHILLRARAWEGDARLDLADYLRECQSLRDFLRRCAEATLSNWALAMVQNGVSFITGDPALPTVNYVLYAGAVAQAFVDIDTKLELTTAAATRSIELGTYQLRTVRVSAGGQDYVEQVFARRGLEWGATLPFAAGIVPIEERYHFHNGVAQFTRTLPRVFSLVNYDAGTGWFRFCRRLRVKHYRNGGIHLLSGDYAPDDGFGNWRGYRYVYSLTSSDVSNMHRYVSAVAYKITSVATVLRCAFPLLGGYDFPDNSVRLGSPWRRITSATELGIASMFAQPMLAIGRQLYIGGFVGTMMGIEQDVVTESATIRVLQHDPVHVQVL